MKINKEMYFLNITKICVAIKNKNILTEIDKVNKTKEKKKYKSTKRESNGS
ncbi:hypothetical protein TEMA_34430 [Terrisporobacter mayombei]|uniref:Uncharacterized protein n=1 Tax=Terrisporobacter mayombei TaxID=1541 RepID=A0ABY9Q7A5_9FIRM|nr:hypothetical protein [Terrisporobacter mayombei]WMT82945.1 hypothetical protein TEMA_34430 [Terrisporobacter mayombei]